MQLAQQIKMRQNQSLVMTPQLQQAIKLLQMTNIELCQFLETQQAENPFLDNETNIETTVKETSSESENNLTSDLSSDINSGESIKDDPSSISDYENRYDADLADRPKLDSPKSSSSSLSNEDYNDLSENLASKPLSLREHLMRQVSIELKEPSDRLIASFLTDIIEPSGWISSEIDSVALEAGCSEEEVLKVLKKVQGFEPAGVYARGLVECLEIQLRELKMQ